MKDLINWHELSRRLSSNGQNIRPNSIPKKYEKEIARLLKILEVWSVGKIGKKYLIMVYLAITSIRCTNTACC